MSYLTYFVDNWSYIGLKIWQHFYLFLFSWLAALLIGLLLSIIASRPGQERWGRLILMLTGAGQAVPSIAVIALSFLFLGIGWKPVLLALFIYSLVPIVFNGTSGLLSVDPAIKQAAEGMGMSSRQILWQLELPLSIRAFAAGARSSATINIGSVAIAAVIGGGGLGELIYTGLRLSRMPIIVAGALPATIMALAIDGLFALAERRITSPGLQLAE